MTPCLPQCNIISALSFTLNGSLTNMVKLRKAMDNSVYFKIFGESYSWFRQNSIFFCPCKGVACKINTPESHLCLQWLIFFLPLSNFLLVCTLLVVFGWRFWASSTAHCLFSPILYWNIMDVVELGQFNWGVHNVRGFCPSRAYRFTWHLVGAHISWTCRQTCWCCFLKHPLLQRSPLNLVKMLSRYRYPFFKFVFKQSNLTGLSDYDFVHFPWEHVAYHYCFPQLPFEF